MPQFKEILDNFVSGWHPAGDPPASQAFWKIADFGEVNFETICQIIECVAFALKLSFLRQRILLSQKDKTIAWTYLINVGSSWVWLIKLKVTRKERLRREAAPQELTSAEAANLGENDG